MELRRFYLAWQDPQNRSWAPVALLTVNKRGTYCFVYTKGAQNGKFMPFGRMQQLDAVYLSEHLFPLLSNRLLSESRPDYKRYLDWLDVSGDDPLKTLAINGGTRGTDTLEVFECPRPSEKGEYDVVFLNHGLSHLPKSAVERVNSLAPNERLFLMLDIQNKSDSLAVAIRTDDPVEIIGYCPRYLASDFCQLLDYDNINDIVVSIKQVNSDAPLNLKLVCRILAPWPKDFKPCSSEIFTPLADYKRLLRRLENDDTPDVSTGEPLAVF